jgi:hypothetical protein
MNTDKNNTQLPQSSVIERFSHTLENCLFAKQELLKDGFSEDDFYLHDASYSDSYLDNEPMMKCDDDDCVSALELYKQKCFSEEEDDDRMIEFFLREGL